MGRQIFSKASADNRVGRLDSQGTWTLADEGMKEEPVAVITSYKIGRDGQVRSENTAFTQPALADYLTTLRAEANNPNNQNPHAANNLRNMTDLAYALNASVEFGVQTNGPKTSEQIQNIGAAKIAVEGVTPVMPANILPPGYTR